MENGGFPSDAQNTLLCKDPKIQKFKSVYEHGHALGGRHETYELFRVPKDSIDFLEEFKIHPDS